ncbi:hypothetical protein [Brevundimonas sp.]|uniref:hypothetical protein n=1 Tax=Brevundimonas sp. TaxID=1871086 RepID=UPI0025EE633E|nr:hypothetical protein [Brevundimonas sp.]
MTTIRAIDPPQGKAEARRRARQPVLAAAHLTRLSDESPVRVTLLDIHGQGARLRLPPNPGELTGALELTSGHGRFLAYLVWRVGDEAGLGFLADLRTENTDCIGRLRQKLSGAAAPTQSGGATR